MRFAAMLSGLLLSSCQMSEPTFLLLPQTDLVVRSVTWNANGTPVGAVAAVVESTGGRTDTVVFGSEGTLVFVAGLLLNADWTVKSWTSAAVVPGSDGAEPWLLGIAQSGELYRLRDRATVESVSDRYGLLGQKVFEAAALDLDQTGAVSPGGLPLAGNLAAFALEHEIAVADGSRVTRYPLAVRKLQGQNGRLAGVSAGQAVVFSPKNGVLKRFVLPAPAVGVVFDAVGHAVVATDSTLYREIDPGDDAGLATLYVSHNAPITSLAQSGGTIWFAAGDSLAVLDSQSVRRASVPTPGLVGGQLMGSPHGDVWVLCNGQLHRYGELGGGEPDERLWKTTVQPVFVKKCSTCHLPFGSAAVDLSTYPAWRSRKALIRQRALEGLPTPMPPVGAPSLTPEERTALSAWLQSP